MPTIKDLQPGQEFYFATNKSDVFIFISHVLKKDGSVRSGRCIKAGKLYPVYFTAEMEIVIIKNKIDKYAKG